MWRLTLDVRIWRLHILTTKVYSRVVRVIMRYPHYCGIIILTKLSKVIKITYIESLLNHYVKIMLKYILNRWKIRQVIFVNVKKYIILHWIIMILLLKYSQFFPYLWRARITGKHTFVVLCSVKCEELLNSIFDIDHSLIMYHSLNSTLIPLKICEFGFVCFNFAR